MFIIYFATNNERSNIELYSIINNLTGFDGILDIRKAADHYIPEYTENAVKVVNKNIPFTIKELVDAAKHMYVAKTAYTRKEAGMLLTDLLKSGQVPAVQFKYTSTLESWSICIVV